MEIDKEKIYKKEIDEITYKLPREFEDYLNILLEKNNHTYDRELFNTLSKIMGYYSKLGMMFNKMPFKVTPEDMKAADKDEIEKYLEFQTINNSRDAIIDYQNYLIEKQALEHITIASAKEKENYLPKQRNARKIKSASDVKFFKDYTRKNSKTTIDLKYSLDKEIKGKYTDYVYRIYDHKKESYILDQNGNILEIKEYVAAREYVKSLYK